MCKRKQYSYSFDHAIHDLDTLSPFQKIILTHRYVLLLSDYERRCFLLSILFHISHIIVTVGSLIVPALLSIQYTDTSSGSNNSAWDSQEFSYQIYWGTWVISLLVTIANGVLALLKIDKKYYFLHTTLEQLRSEGWQFLELSGRYSGFHRPDEAPTHNNQFIYFCHMIEKIKMKQVEEEYYKLNESQATVTGATVRAPLPQEAQLQQVPTSTQQPEERRAQPTLVPDGLIPPTPLNPLLLKLLNSISVEKASQEQIGGNVSEPKQTTEVSKSGKHGSGGSHAGEQRGQQVKRDERAHGDEQSGEEIKVSVRSELSEPPITKNLILRSTSEVLPASESDDGLGTKISTV